jgi:hypothetical protein
MAYGYGGQLLYVDPSRRALVVVCSDLAHKGPDWDVRLIETIEKRVLPALQERPSD